MNLERILCPICGKDNTTVLFTKGDLNLDVTNVICNTCALVYVNPRPPAWEFLAWQAMSEKGSGHHTQNTPEKARLKINANDRLIKTGVVNYLSKFINSKTKILDIGAGYGTILGIVKEKFGIVGEGIELNDPDVQIAKKIFDIKLYSCTLEIFHENFNNVKKYNLIILHHTFEHFDEPFEELKRISDLLEDDGLLYIAVPNILNMKKRPEIFFQTGHAFSYSPASLAKMLNRAGFKIIDFNLNAAYPGGMEGVSKKSSSATTAFQDSILDFGHNPDEVITYVTKRAKTFSLLRRLRDNVLFFLPQSWRINLGRQIYLFFKTRK